MPTFTATPATRQTAYRHSPYAPESNPVEGIWSHLKRSLGSLAARTTDELAALARTRLRRMQSVPPRPPRRLRRGNRPHPRTTLINSRRSTPVPRVCEPIHHPVVGSGVLDRAEPEGAVRAGPDRLCTECQCCRQSFDAKQAARKRCCHAVGGGCRKVLFSATIDRLHARDLAHGTFARST